MDVATVPCRTFVGAVRHHRHFTENAAARERIATFRARIEADGVRAFVDAEYPPGSGKAFIVNETAGRLCLVDGNAHLVALVACRPELTLAQLMSEAKRSDIVRFWRDGWEEGSGQEAAYEVFIPQATDATRIPGCYDGTDWFKSSPQPTKIMPATVPFDSPLFAPEDRGRTLEETVRVLDELAERGSRIR